MRALVPITCGISRPQHPPDPVYDSNLYSSKDKNGRSVTPFALFDLKDGDNNQKALKDIVQKNAIIYKGSQGQYAMYSPGRWSDGSSVRCRARRVCASSAPRSVLHVVCSLP